MPRKILVSAAWDAESNVWVAESADLPGLVTEAATIEALIGKLPGMIRDLLDCEGDDVTSLLDLILPSVQSFRQMRVA